MALLSGNSVHRGICKLKEKYIFDLLHTGCFYTENKTFLIDDL